MSRRRAAQSRVINPDAKYGHVVIGKFINTMMYDGKKSVAESAMYEALEKFSQQINIDPVEAFETVLNKVRPSVEIRSRRVGGATYQVPCEIRAARRTALAIRWLISAARLRKDKKTMAEKLHAEFLDAYGDKGGAVKKKDDVHRMAESNKAYSHLNW